MFNIVDNQVVRVYILGHKAEGDLERPWIQKSPFAAAAAAANEKKEKSN